MSEVKGPPGVNQIDPQLHALQRVDKETMRRIMLEVRSRLCQERAAVTSAIVLQKVGAA